MIGIWQERKFPDPQRNGSSVSKFFLIFDLKCSFPQDHTGFFFFFLFFLKHKTQLHHTFLPSLLCWEHKSCNDLGSGCLNLPIEFL